LGKGEEPLLTLTYRDRLMTREEFARLGRDTQDEALDSLISFGRSKVHERFRLNIIHSILARNGAFPISNGGLEQVDISWRAYASYMMDRRDHVLPLHLAPWGPQFYVCLFKPMERAIVDSAMQGEENYRRQCQSDDSGDEFSSMRSFTAGRRSYSERVVGYEVYEDLVAMYEGFLQTNWPRARGIPGGGTEEQNYELIDMLKLNLPVRKLNLIAIIDEVKALVPGVEPGAVISHIRFEDVVAAVRESSVVRERVAAELAQMKAKAEHLGFNERINGHFMKYLLERAAVLESMLSL
ncbi:MAG: hypothetical protein U9Q67_03985, partial [Patescibacteria group bacterium]|nr:hypothetical protein [Patescibacteria group bacterium]